MARVLGALATALWLAVGCGGPPSEDSPAGALRLFFEAITRAQGAAGSERDEALEEAYDLLDSVSRDRLGDRARAAEALGARDHDGFEMLAAYPSRDGELPTRSSSFREAIDPDGIHATVSVRLETLSIEVPMVREVDGEGNAAWRVVLTVPEVETD